MLHGFAHALVARLVEARLLEVRVGGETEVVAHVAERLAAVETGSLVSEIVRALTTCDAVDELYADDRGLMDVISDLGPAAARGA